MWMNEPCTSVITGGEDRQTILWQIQSWAQWLPASLRESPFEASCCMTLSPRKGRYVYAAIMQQEVGEGSKCHLERKKYFNFFSWNQEVFLRLNFTSLFSFWIFFLFCRSLFYVALVVLCAFYSVMFRSQSSCCSGVTTLTSIKMHSLPPSVLPSSAPVHLGSSSKDEKSMCVLYTYVFSLSELFKTSYPKIKKISCRQVSGLFTGLYC